MLASLLTLASLYLVPAAVRAEPCIAFDIDWNLLAFGLDGKDWSAGTQDQWASGKASDITTSGRPPFDGANTTCYLSQFTNAIYVANADGNAPSDIHIYDATAKSWSTQSVTTGNFDPTSFTAILDHDTNVFYAASHGELYHLDMGLLKSANSTALDWVDVEALPYSSGYEPVMALAQNHIHFLDVPNTPAGNANIYVIHFNFFQPDAQSYPASSGSSFPATHGQTASFFQAVGVQEEFAFIPDDGSATYVVNVENNSTQTLAGPTTKDARATYFAGITSLVQLDSSGAVSYLPYNTNDTAANAQATWTPIPALASVAPPGSSGGISSGNSTSSASSGAPKTTGSAAAKPSGSSAASASASSTPNSAAALAAPSTLVGGVVSAMLIAVGAALL
ncbi:hypothetical protein FA95DRAFT_1552741 [Auriscalpium vulgare]|uniref:Uncharacterized protein n=1 Tax=Auriscalpium vulgare TaxID=40419 RepID=A0ACB8S9C2_9AGAM|nr:hypothetical protein FA95DRAFT_1552741 [Auriscalpium vulgare]